MRAFLTLGVLVALTVAASAQAPAPSGPATTPLPRPSAASPAAPAAGQALIDINAASKDELKQLAGIGDARADAIIKGRPYRGKDELTQKNIIPDGVYGGIKDRIIARQAR